MAGLARIMAVLRLYTPERPSWAVPTMGEALGLPSSTIYRAVSEMVAAGLLEASSDSRYRLGPAFIEFDRLTRLTDPLLRAGHAILQDTVAQARLPCVGLLSRLYNDTVMCVADAATPGIDFQSSYERGRPMPLTSGATSKVILARLPPRRLATLLSRNGVETASAAFKTELAEIRRRGFTVSRGEIDAGLVGLAAPVVGPALGLIASLSLVVQARDLAPERERALTLLLVSAAGLLKEALREKQDVLF
jgi:DNA-binding IclR family transcriptional regulator